MKLLRLLGMEKMSSLEKKMVGVVLVLVVIFVYSTYRVVSEISEHGLEAVLTCIWKGAC